MIVTPCRTAASLAALALSACAGLPPPAPAATPPDAPLGWMKGCWQSQSGGDTREVWSQSYDGFLFGYSITLQDGAMRFFEDLRIETRGADTVYIASPRGTAPTVFTLTETGPNEAVFTNPDHDYPQRIAYTRAGDRLTATISLADKSDARVFAFAACD